MAATGTKTKTITFPRMILILNSIKFAYKCILHQSERECRKWLNAFKAQELQAVTFCATTVQNGERKLLIEFEIGIDWDTYNELVKITPDVTLPAIPEHTSGVLITINEAVNTYLELVDYALALFPDCKTSDWYSYSKRVRADSMLLENTRKKLGLAPSGKYPAPYSGNRSKNVYKVNEAKEISTSIQTFFE